MFARSRHWIGLVGLILSQASNPASGQLETADRIIFKNGEEIDGQIIRREADSITVQGANGKKIIAERDIRRIDDTATTASYFAAAHQPLPPWNAIVNDLRANEEVRRRQLISSGRETHGKAAGWSYLRYKINESVEVRIYGDPKNPAGIQLGLNGGKALDQREQNNLRTFFAGFLIERSQIAALYALRTSGGEKTAGNLRIAFGSQRQTKDQPNWWLSAWNVDARPKSPKAFQKFRDGDTGFWRDQSGDPSPLRDPNKVALGF